MITHKFKVGDKVRVCCDGRWYKRTIEEVYSNSNGGYKVDKPVPEGTDEQPGFVSWNELDMAAGWDAGRLGHMDAGREGEG